MYIQISGKHIELGAALQERITTGLEACISKYFDRPGEGHVTVSKAGWAFAVEISVHLPSGVNLQSHGEGAEAHGAFEDALEKVEKRVRRYKQRLKEHHHRAREPMPVEPAQQKVIRVVDEELDEPEIGDAPAIIAEFDTKIQTMTVSMAVMQLELTDSPALLFRNAAHGGLNMVFRRPDTNVGWVDPGRDV